jgi:hypothetical protein
MRAARALGKREAKRAFGVAAPRVASKTRFETKSGSSTRGTSVPSP